MGGRPALRMGDLLMSVPPVPLMMGCFTVIIGGKPAGRMGDLVMPHKFTPFAPPKPIHPMNPVAIMPNFTVIIGGKPAAHMGDTELLRHPFFTGCFTVIV